MVDNTAHYDWQLAKQPDSSELAGLAQQLNVSPFLARLLWQRDITTPAAWTAFTQPQTASLHDPLQLHDMQKAVDRITKAVAAGEKITIYGDYDVDGLTSSAIMKEAIESIGGEPDVFIPDRFTDGYGPNAAVYKYLQASGTQLVVTVDNGVAGKAVIDAAMAAGMDVVVTDHHELPEDLPNAVAVVHPRHPAGDYPFGDLSGAGVAFKVATALLGEVPMDSIDLAALGTIADLVSLTDENRVLVQLGLAMIRTQPRVGLAALLQVAGIDPATVDEQTVGFGIAPRLNALGRLGDANPGVTLLTTFDDDEAASLAANVNARNEERQGLVRKIAQQALAMANEPENAAKRTLILARSGWHEGVLGIVASHVVEATGKPTLVLNIAADGQNAKGSGRSVAGYHLFKSLEPAKAAMTHFGGHAMAVGLTMPVANLETVHEAMEKAAAVSLKDQAQPALAVAARLDASELTLENYQALRQLAPFGQGNPEPVFSVLPQRIDGVRQIGKGKDHLKFQADGIDVIAFGSGDQASDLAAATQAKLAVTLDQNTWQGRTSLQLRLSDWQLQAPAVIDLRLPQPSAEQFRGAFTYVFFDPQMLTRMSRRFQFGGPTMLAKDLAPDTSNVVLVDLPADEASLQAAMNHVQLPVRVVFAADPAHLVALPSRQECGRVLLYLRQHPGFDKHHLPALAQAVHVTTQQAIFAVQVFFELEFVKIEGALISVNPHPTKTPLDQAQVYLKRQAFLALAAHLQTDDRQALTQRLTQF
ncbi:single-stranded-DNA-specific exonuclease RecJ [Lacticaseibacillus baoqingensis]|uniref:Single-stranded-DNA-specific exonuclease RecJ n=1 Tax=Lacticaseibacillus baoqingensis TaxID=2486013 RepID=A0ABW4E6Z2_9LACO|nr:single-stranded-DNA-specific exonuclease RecJ [Lacticaseibacillus baoqingensis]